MLTRLRHILLLVQVAPVLLLPRHRHHLAAVRAFIRRLPQALNAPLPQALATLTPPHASSANSPSLSLIDLAALLERASPLGLCLRRSLARYHYLRAAGMPLTLNFGARLVNGKADREIAGHAWVTLTGEPFHEESDNYQGFTVMFRYPPEETTA